MTSLRVSTPGVSHLFRVMTGAMSVGVALGFCPEDFRIKVSPRGQLESITIRYRKIIIFLCRQIDIQVRFQSNHWCGSCSPIQRGKRSADCFEMCLSEVMLDGLMIINCVDEE